MNQSGHDRLAFLAAEINENFDAVCAAEETMKTSWVEMVRRALATGAGLLDAQTDVKATYGHGHWTKWRNANCERVGERWSQVLMRLARNSKFVEQEIAKKTKSAGTAYLTLQGLDEMVAEKERAAKQAKWLSRAKRPKPGESVTWPGDTWELGNHLLHCGDARRCTEIWRASPGGVQWWDLLLTDPPYGDKRIKGMANNNISDWRAVWKNVNSNRGFVFHAGTEADKVMEGLKASGFEIKEHLVWRKPRGERGKRLHHLHEPILYVERSGTPSAWVKRKLQTSVLDYGLPGDERAEAEGHLTPKPVALLMQLIQAASKRGDPVIDPFAGSGSTLIACQRTGRNCSAIELDPFYCDVSIRRWQRLTGRHAILWMGEDDSAPHGSRFNDLAADPSLRPRHQPT